MRQLISIQLSKNEWHTILMALEDARSVEGCVTDIGYIAVIESQIQNQMGKDWASIRGTD